MKALFLLVLLIFISRLVFSAVSDLKYWVTIQTWPLCSLRRACGTAVLLMRLLFGMRIVNPTGGHGRKD